QLKGRKITAFFANNNIDRIFVDGNAENISFAADEKSKIITEMLHDRGARIKVKMQNKEIIDYITIRKVDQKVYPFNMVNQENEILQGFIWRPQDRPTSKEDLLNRKRELPKETVPAATADPNASGEQTSEEPSSKAAAPEDTPVQEKIPEEVPPADKTRVAEPQEEKQTEENTSEQPQLETTDE